MTIEFKTESARDVWDEIQPLLLAHKAEVAHYDDIALKPRREVYFALCDSGKLTVSTVRVDGRLVGYVVHVTDFDIHYGSSKQARQDILFLLPEYRGGGMGATLINFADGNARRSGAQVAHQHTKIKPGLYLGPLFAMLGYEKVEEIWTKRLDRGG